MSVVRGVVVGALLLVGVSASANQQLVVGGTLGWTFGDKVAGFTPGLHLSWQRVNGNADWQPMLANEVRVDAPGMRVFRAGTTVSVGVVNATVGSTGFAKRYGVNADVGALWSSEGGLQPVLGGHADTFIVSWEGRWAHQAGTTFGATLDLPLLPVTYLLVQQNEEGG